MDYREAESELLHALTFGIHPSLSGIEALCEALGRPQDAFRSVQVTGTNGKTSTVRFIEAILRAEGVVTGLYTSPHLERYPERIETRGIVIDDESFGRAVGAVLVAAETLRPGAQGTAAGFTEFELLTAAALWHFRRHDVQIAVLEVGMGGRWDATSVVTPAVSVITGVGLDHCAILGDTVEAIAEEKASIVRPGSTAVFGPGTAAVARTLMGRAGVVGVVPRVVRESGDPGGYLDGTVAEFTVRERPAAPGGVTVMDIDGILGDHRGVSIAAPAYQAANVATAVVAAEAVLGRALRAECLRGAVLGLALPGRFELVRAVPPAIVDGSHNPQAAAVLAGAVADAWPDRSHRPTFLLGVLADKDAEGIVRALAPVAGGIVATSPASGRALPVRRLAEVVEGVTGIAPLRFDDVRTALEVLVGTRDDGLVVTGSLTTAAEAREHLRHLG